MSSSAASIQLPHYEIAGAHGAPAVAALGGISATRHVCATGEDRAPGWWERIAGERRAIDTTRFRVVGMDYADGGRGADGRPKRVVTTYDQADILAAVLDDIGIRSLHALVGASYGGMVALAFAERYPERLERLVVIGAAHRAHPMTMAVRTIQRRIVELGLETGRARDALAIARGLAVTTYRSAAEFSHRFSSLTGLTLIEEYLRAQGERFAGAFTPERYLALSHSADVHRVDPSLIATPAVLVAIEGDAVVPREQIADLASLLAGPALLADLPSDKGHDGFLTEHRALASILTLALGTGIPS